MEIKRSKIIPLLIFFSAAILFLPPIIASAAITDYKLEMPLLPGQETVSTPGQYIKMLFIFGLSMAGIVALFSVVWGGLTYLTSGSSETRKTEGKKWIYAAISGVILLLFSYLIFITLAGPQFVSLQEPRLNQTKISATPNNPYQLEMPLAGSSQMPKTPGEYIKLLFIFGLGGVGIVALFAFVYGGILYLLSGGYQAMKTHGKQWILAALSGLTLLLCSYLILATINPSLVDWSTKPLDQISIGGADQQNTGTINSPYRLEMPLGNSNQAPANPGEYIRIFFIFGLGGVGLVALFAIIFGGLNYILSGSSQTRAMEGRKWISGAVAGVMLLLLSFLILYTINPNLTSLKINALDKVSVGNDASNTQNIGNVDNPYQLEIPFSGPQQSAKTPSEYITLLFVYGLGLIGVVALFAIIFGGLNYIFSGSSETRKTEGKKWITGAVAGIALLLCSYLILGTINPQLLTLQNPKLDTIIIPPHLGLSYNDVVSLKDMNAVRGMPVFQDPVVQKALQDATAYYKIDPALAAFVLGIEHDKNNPYGGVSPKGAQGLMQLMPSTAIEMGVQNPFDPEQSIRGGVGYLAKIRDTYLPQAGLPSTNENILAAYNAGIGKVKSAGGGAYVNNSETQKYLQAAREKGIL